MTVDSSQSEHGYRFPSTVFRRSNALWRVVCVAALGVLVLALSGCAAGGVAATVNGVEITDQEVGELTIDGEDASTTDAGIFRNLLTNEIVTVSMLTAAEEDLGLGDLSTSESTEAYLASASEQDQALIEGVASDPNLTDDAVRLVTVQLNIRSAVTEQITSDDAFMQEVWQNDQDLMTMVCARHILVITEEEAIVAKERVDAGEDFSSVATEMSLDTQSPGGAFPCPSAPTDFPPALPEALATAPVGEVTGPVSTQFGFHIVIVDSREGPASFEEFAQDPDRWMPAAATDAAWASWINDALAVADIEVRSQIGTWSPTANAIAPPPPSP